MPRQRANGAKLYYPYLRKFLSWKDGTEYAPTTRFTDAHVQDIRPNHIVRYMSLLAYGTEQPGDGDHPTIRRSSGMEFVKKAISFFMPNRNVPWNVESQSGNPTMSVAVNDLIKRIKKAEVRKQGKKSGAKRDMKRPEYRKTLRLLEEMDSFGAKYRTPTMMKLQFHIIGRADDVSNVETEDLRSHDKFSSFALQTKVSWSKNVLEERECPDQILIGAMDPDFCVLLGLACYLETRFSTHQPAPAGRRFLFGEQDDDDEAVRINERYQRVLRNIWKKDPAMLDLISQVRGDIGTHSVRKFPATWAAEHGVSQDHIEIRGRWKGGKGGRVVNRYINVEQLPTDGHVASILAIGGPVKYKARAGSGFTHQFLMQHVVPGIHQHYGDASNRIAEVLALPLLWAAFQPGLEHMMSAPVRARIRIQYELIRPDDYHADWNPVSKVPLIVTRVENTLVIDELAVINVDGAPDAPAPPQVQEQQVVHAQALHGHTAQLQMCLNQVHLCRQQVSEAQAATQQGMAELKGWMNIKFETQTRNLNKLRQAAHFAPAPRANGDNDGPAVQQQGFVGGAGIPAGDAAVDLNNDDSRGPPRATATLSTGPKSVHDLWQEYQHGIGGRLPARRFRPSERGRCKNTYSRRNLVWKIVKDMILAGLDADVACDRIYQAYGHNKSVSYIIDRIYRDKREAGGKDAPGESWKHPNLRVGA